MISILWGLLGFVLIGVQVAFGQVEFLFLAAAALVVALITAIVPGLDQNFLLQLGIWVALSFFCFIFLRRKFRNAFQGKEIKQEKDEFSGQKAEVIEAIYPGKTGRIKFQGTSWGAMSETENLPVGTPVEILEKNGFTFVVTGQSLDQEIQKQRSLHDKEWETLQAEAEKPDLDKKEK